MEKIIEKVIESKNYELSDMLKKIDTLWVQGSIDEEVKVRLAEKARENADVQNSISILEKLEELDKRVKALEETKVETEEKTEYMPGKWYYNGDIVTFEGNTYKCIAPKGVVCTWSPTEYPTYWEAI